MREGGSGRIRGFVVPVNDSSQLKIVLSTKLLESSDVEWSDMMHVRS